MIYAFNSSVYILRSNTLFYCAMTIYIPYILFKSNRVWFEKYRSGISLYFLTLKRLGGNEFDAPPCGFSNLTSPPLVFCDF